MNLSGGMSLAIDGAGIFGGSLASIVPSCVFDLDATLAASYGGTGQVWANLVPAPADGAAKAAYDFYLGAGGSIATDDPTFTGAAGSPSAYFMLDGGDIFQIAGGNTAFIESLHKSTGMSNWWLSLAFRCADQLGNAGMVSTNNSGTAIGSGIRLNLSATEVPGIFQGDGTTSIAKTIFPSPITIGSDYVLVASFNGSSLRTWNNSRIKTAQALTYLTNTAPALSPLKIGVSASSGTRIYAASMGNSYIGDSDVSKIFDAYNARHGRTYA